MSDPAGVSGSDRLPLVQTPKMTAEELAEHLRLLRDAQREDLDELLTDLLCHIYKTRDTQDS